MTSLIGREREVRIGTEVLDDARKQQVPRLLHIAGPSGIGKTAIALGIAEQANSAGWHTAFAAAHRIQAMLPLVAARRMLNSLIESLGDTAERYTSGLETEIKAATAPGSSNTTAIEDALLRLLEALLIDRPVLLIFDDAQWADIETRALFVRLLHALADRPLVLISTQTGDETTPPAFEFADSQLIVDELDEASIVELARATLPGANADVLAAIAEHARGRAIDVIGLANAGGDPALMTVDNVKSTLRALIAREVNQLGAETREFLQICALISEPVPYELLRTLWPDESDLSLQITKCLGRFLNHSGSALHFVHTAVAQSIRETIAIEIPYRRRIIAALESLPLRPEDYERLADQASACGERDLERKYLLQLTEAATTAGDFGLVASALDRAIRLGGSDASTSLAMYSRLGTTLLVLSREYPTIRVCEEGLERALASGISEGLGPLVASLLFAHWHVGGSNAFARIYDRYEGALKSPIDRAHILSSRLFAATSAGNESMYAQSVSEFDTLGVENPVFTVRRLTFGGLHAAQNGNFSDAVRSFDRARVLAQQSVPAMRRMVDVAISDVTFRQFGSQAQQTRDATAGTLVGEDTARRFEIVAQIDQGNFADAIVLVNESLVHESGTFNRRLLLGFAATAAALGETTLSAMMREQIEEEASRFLRGDESQAVLSIAMAHALLSAKADRTKASALVARVSKYICERPFAPHIFAFPILLARAAHATNSSEALQVLSNREAQHDRQKWTVAQYDLAQAYASAILGKPNSANDLTRIRDTFTELGAPFYAEQTQQLLTPAKAPNGGGSTSPLTRREREVAALVADGSTNRDIAQRLVLSERTVEAHIANIFAKLNASSRAQIAAWHTRSTSVV